MPVAIVAAREHTAIGPELFHYPTYHMALLWGCAHDRVELRNVETEVPARWNTGAGVYECGNGHLYERHTDATWTAIKVGIEEAA